VTDDAGNSADATISLKMKESFPDLTVTMPEVNVFGGVVLQVSGNKLLIGGEEVASWSDKIAEPCKATFSLNGQEVKDGDVLSQPGTLTVTVTNNQERSSSAEITLITNAMSSAIQISDMQVGKEVDLLAGITLANGAELVKVEMEMDGTTAEITDPQHFTPDYPGTCSFIFTVKGKNGDMEEVRADDLTIKPLDYAEAVLEVANMIAEKYPWYKNLWQSTKDFIYPHLLASYAACNWSKQDNRVHIIMGETTDASDVENI
jgi:hypothetical protein